MIDPLLKCKDVDSIFFLLKDNGKETLINLFDCYFFIQPSHYSLLFSNRTLFCQLKVLTIEPISFDNKIVKVMNMSPSFNQNLLTWSVY